MWLNLIALTLFQLLKTSAQDVSVKVATDPVVPADVKLFAVSLDINGSFFYLGGHSYTNFDNQKVVGTADAFLCKLFLNGTRVWSRFVGGLAFETCKSIVQNPSTLDVFLIATAQSVTTGPKKSGAGGDDGLIAKFTPNGTKLFTLWIGETGTDQFQDAFLDAKTQRISIVGTCNEWICLTSNAINNGSKLSQFLFPVEGIAYGVAPDSSLDGYYLTGKTSQPLDEETYFGGFSNTFLAKINAKNSTRYWHRIWGNPFGQESYAVQFDPNSQLVFIAAQTGGGSINEQTPLGNQDALLICAHSNGTHLWTRQFGTNLSDSAASLAIHRPTGMLFVVGATDIYGFVASFAQNGTMLRSFVQDTPSQYTDICFDPSLNKAYVSDFSGIIVTLQISGDFSKSSSVPVLTTPLTSHVVVSTKIPPSFVAATTIILPSLLVAPTNILQSPVVTPTIIVVAPTTIVVPEPTVSASQDSSVVGESATDVTQTTTSAEVTSGEAYAITPAVGISVVLPLVVVAAVLVLVVGLLSFRVLRIKSSNEKTDITSTPAKLNSVMSSAESTEGTAMTAQGSTTMDTLLRSNFELSLPGYLLFKNGIAYRILVQIARGGGGSVFMGDAFDLKLRRYGAKLIVKTVGQGAGSLLSELTPAQTESFNQEVSIMHFFREEKHIAKLLGWSDAPACLLMKLYSLGSLDKWVRGSSHVQMTKSIALNFMRDISRGVMAMHLAGFVHCDLKPHNVLIDVDEKDQLFCVLTDFGITQVVNDSSLLVRDFAVINLGGLSLQYAAPEAFQRFRSRVRSAKLPGELIMKLDLYSLSVIMLELLQRATPWHQ